MAESRSLCTYTCFKALANSLGLPDGTIYPDTPSLTKAAVPVWSVTTTGFENIIASVQTIGMGSSKEGQSTTSTFG